jgi:hypothetical protein
LPITLVGIFPATAPLLAVSGAGVGLGDVAGRTLLQRLAPRQVMARAFGVLEGMATAGLAVGAVVAPILINLVGAQGAFVVLGLLLHVAAVAGWPMIRAADTSAHVPEAEVGILERVAMLRLLNPPALEALALGSHVEEVERGRVVIRQRDAGDCVYVIDAGRHVVIVDGHPVNTLERGDIFGEIALIADVPRTATVAAVEDGRLLAIEGHISRDPRAMPRNARYLRGGRWPASFRYGRGRLRLDRSHCERTS